MIKKRFTDDKHDKFYELKLASMEKILGKSHELVRHAIIPFPFGPVDMYYFPNALSGCAFATMELIKPDGSGPNAKQHENL